jgi:hypothetical protein
LTSIVLYIVPHGRVAYWSEWKLWGLTKTEWANVHINLGYLLIIFSFIHIFYNWKTILVYLKDKMKKLKILTPDFNIAFLIVIIVTLGTLLQIPPFISVIDLSDWIKDEATKKYGEPPYGHAELSSLKVFSKNVEVDLQIAKEKLSQKGIKFESDQQSLVDISRLNKTSPKKIYEIIKPAITENGQKLKLPEKTKSGIGKIPLVELSKKYDVDLNKIMKILADNDLKAKPEMTIKEIALDNNKGAPDVYEIIKEGLKK